MPDLTGAGSGDDFDPWDLTDVRERVVMPVVTSLIRAPDLERVDLGWGPQEPVWGLPSGPPVALEGMDGLYFGEHDPSEQPALQLASDELWLLIVARDSTWHSQIWQIEMAEQMPTLGDVAWDLANRLEDWVCERVYWGEQALARIAIPARGRG
jgi:hypothetical protein